MKILIPLLFLTLGVNANEVVYGSKSGKVELGGEGTVKIVDVAAGETIQILSVTGGYQRNGEGGITNVDVDIQVKHGDLLPMSWQQWGVAGSRGVNRRYYNVDRPVIDDLMVGPCTIQLNLGATDSSSYTYQVSYKITKPSAAGTTTSAPILLPPTQDAAKSWFVKLQVSSDLKAWDDVAPGQFLGSDTARFFRIQTTEAE
ncbi:hypothetical protein OAF19_01625 [bacterium]|nr:hypothetical protein [bacterium]